MRRLRRTPRGSTSLGLVLACGLVLGTGGCGETSSSSSEGVRGKVEGIDDTGLPPTASSGGWIAAVPAARTDDLLALADERPPASELAWVRFLLDRDEVEALGGVVADIDEEGRFQLSVSGEQLVCRLREGTKGTYAAGCAEVDLPERGEVRVATGEAGFRIGVE